MGTPRIAVSRSSAILNAADGYALDRLTSESEHELTGRLPREEMPARCLEWKRSLAKTKNNSCTLNQKREVGVDADHIVIILRDVIRMSMATDAATASDTTVFSVLATRGRPLCDTACMLSRPLPLHLRILFVLRQDCLQVVLDVSHGRPIRRIVLPHPLEQLHDLSPPSFADGECRGSVQRCQGRIRRRNVNVLT